jgi:UDP-2,3-diacylglucosamine hydrolase
MKDLAVFASDFHVSSRDPGSVEALRSFIDERVRGAGAFFVLGDLFDLWIGSAQLQDPGLAPALDALRGLAADGTAVTLLQGNRDFLLGRREGARLGVRVAGESLGVDVQGMRLFLTHGDVFCSRDRPYQRMKTVLRSPVVRGLARILPPFAVRALARRLRARSERAVSAKPPGVTSLHIPDVEALVREKGFDAVICGHVHQSDERGFAGGARLVVLSEWTGGSGIYAVARDGLIERRAFPEGAAPRS